MTKKAMAETKEVDLAALVDIMGNMLFFLLATVVFVQLHTVNASIPTVGTPGDGVSVNVEIKADGYVVKTYGLEQNVDATLPRDTQKLTKQLWAIKQLSLATKSITITPDDEITTQEILATIDAAREMPSISDPKRKVPLFTKPALADKAI